MPSARVRHRKRASQRAHQSTFGKALGALPSFAALISKGRPVLVASYQTPVLKSANCSHHRAACAHCAELGCPPPVYGSSHLARRHPSNC